MFVIRDGLNSETVRQYTEAYKTKGEDCIELNVSVVQAYARYLGYSLTKKLTSFQFRHCVRILIIDIRCGRFSGNISAGFVDRICNMFTSKLELLIEPCASSEVAGIKYPKGKFLDLEVYFDIEGGSCSSELVFIMFRDYARCLGIRFFTAKHAMDRMLRAMHVDALSKSLCWFVPDKVIVASLMSTIQHNKGHDLFGDALPANLKLPKYKNIEQIIRQKRGIPEPVLPPLKGIGSWDRPFSHNKYKTISCAA